MHKILPILILIALGLTAKSQDIHWTQFYMAPVQLNPARAGNFHGTARVAAIARTQSNSIAKTGFFTYAFSVDAPILKGLRDKDWIGVGLSFATDKAGELEVGIQSSSFSGSYHYAMNKKGSTYLTLGVQVESYGRKVGNSQAAEFRSGGTDALVNGTDFKSATGYAAGLELKTALNKRTNFRIGGKVARIGKVSVGIGASPEYEVPTRFTFHTDLDIGLKPKLRFMPGLLYENYGSASAFVFQGRAKYLVNAKKNIDATAGLGYRFGDALEVLVGVGIGDLEIGIGYDLPVSSQASEAIPLGGLELGITYIMKIFKEPKVDPIIFCPRF